MIGQMHKSSFLFPVLAFLVVGCIPSEDDATTDQQAGVERDIYVASQRVDCVGVGPMKCLQVRESPSQPWKLFYSNIEGFEFQEGTSYRLRVLEIPVANPPADGSSIHTTLKEVLETN